MSWNMDPSLSRRLFPELPIRPDLRPRRPGIDVNMQPESATEDIKNREKFDIAMIIMDKYDKIVYEPAVPLILKRMPALSRQDLNYQMIRNLAESKIYQCKNEYIKLYRDGNWQMISDLLVLHISNTVISKYLSTKTKKMTAKQGADGLDRFMHGDTTTGYFPVNGPIAEIPYVIADDTPLPVIGGVGTSSTDIRNLSQVPDNLTMSEFI